MKSHYRSSLHAYEQPQKVQRVVAINCAELRSFRRGWKQCYLSGQPFNSIVARQSVFLEKRWAWRCVCIASSYLGDVETRSG